MIQYKRFSQFCKFWVACSMEHSVYCIGSTDASVCSVRSIYSISVPMSHVCFFTLISICWLQFSCSCSGHSGQFAEIGFMHLPPTHLSMDHSVDSCQFSHAVLVRILQPRDAQIHISMLLDHFAVHFASILFIYGYIQVSRRQFTICDSISQSLLVVGRPRYRSSMFTFVQCVCSSWQVHRSCASVSHSQFCSENPYGGLTDLTIHLPRVPYAVLTNLCFMIY